MPSPVKSPVFSGQVLEVAYVPSKRLHLSVDALPNPSSPDTMRSAAVFPLEMGALVASVFHDVSSQAAYLGSFAVVRRCCRKP